MKPLLVSNDFVAFKKRAPLKKAVKSVFNNYSLPFQKHKPLHCSLHPSGIHRGITCFSAQLYLVSLQCQAPCSIVLAALVSFDTWKCRTTALLQGTACLVWEWQTLDNMKKLSSSGELRGLHVSKFKCKSQTILLRSDRNCGYTIVTNKEFPTLGYKASVVQSLLASGQLNPTHLAEKEDRNHAFVTNSIDCLVKDVGGLWLSWWCYWFQRLQEGHYSCLFCP